MELTFLRAEITSHSHYRETWLDRKYPGRDRSKRASFSTHESAMEYGWRKEVRTERREYSVPCT